MGNEFTFNKTVRYRCNPGYIMDPPGLDTLRCSKDGSWNQTKPGCRGMEKKKQIIISDVLLLRLTEQRNGNRGFIMATRRDNVGAYSCVLPWQSSPALEMITTELSHVALRMCVLHTSSR